MRLTTRTDAPDGDPTFDAFARGEAANAAERLRTRRGGPRAPFLLLPVIGVAAGIGIAYVSQSAHLTQTGYEQSTLASQQADLQRADSALGDELDRLRSPSRIDAAAARLGLKPPTKWTYVPAQPAPVAAPAGSAVTAGGPAPSLHTGQVVEALGGRHPGATTGSGTP